MVEMSDNQTTKRHHPARAIILDRELRPQAKRNTLYDRIAGSILIGGLSLIAISMAEESLQRLIRKTLEWV